MFIMTHLISELLLSSVDVSQYSLAISRYEQDLIFDYGYYRRHFTTTLSDKARVVP